MADNKNMELGDEMMVQATGGAGTPAGQAEYKVGDRVCYTLTNPENGMTMTVYGKVDEVFFDGSKGGWRYKITCEPSEFNCTELEVTGERLTRA